jgi:hypothetical protein
MSARALGRVVLGTALLTLTACSDQGDPLAGPAIPTDVTDPVAAVTSHFLSIEQRDLDAYTVLLEPGFTFYPPSFLIGDFPWDAGRPLDAR